jgi:hypothetical protein
MLKPRRSRVRFPMTLDFQCVGVFFIVYVSYIVCVSIIVS